VARFKNKEHFNLSGACPCSALECVCGDRGPCDDGDGNAYRHCIWGYGGATAGGKGIVGNRCCEGGGREVDDRDRDSDSGSECCGGYGREVDDRGRDGDSGSGCGGGNGAASGEDSEES
jgi:hypothetical protein